MEVEPAASQLQEATVVVAHLAMGELPDPEIDANSIGDVTTVPLQSIDE